MAKRKNKGNSLITSTIMFFLVMAFLLVKEFVTDSVSLGVTNRAEAAQQFEEGASLLEVHFLDVGQGDATLIAVPDENGGSDFILIDCGESFAKSDLLYALDEYNVDVIDLFVITHPHSDHMANASSVLEEYDVEKILMNDLEVSHSFYKNFESALKLEDAEVVYPAIGDKYAYGDLVLTVLGPGKDMDTEDLNNMSIVLRADYNKRSFLLMGDAEAESEYDLMDRFMQIKADVLKLGHHGSSTSSAEDFVDLVMPMYAVASCGLDNEYGHPHREVVSYLNKLRITLFRTDTDGYVFFYTDGNKLVYLTENNTAAK